MKKRNKEYDGPVNKSQAANSYNTRCPDTNQQKKKILMRGRGLERVTRGYSHMCKVAVHITISSRTLPLREMPSSHPLPYCGNEPLMLLSISAPAHDNHTLQRWLLF
jgi:hypothetical protein